jgi:hypothetical protein
MRVGGTTNPSPSDLEIDNEVIFGGRLYRQIGRLLALENAIDIRGRAPDNIGRVGSIGDQRAFRHVLPKTINRRESMPLRQCHTSQAYACAQGGVPSAIPRRSASAARFSVFD